MIISRILATLLQRTTNRKSMCTVEYLSINKNFKYLITFTLRLLIRKKIEYIGVHTIWTVCDSWRSCFILKYHFSNLVIQQQVMNRQNYIAENLLFVCDKWSCADKTINVNVAYTKSIVWNITIDMQSMTDSMQCCASNRGRQLGLRGQAIRIPKTKLEHYHKLSIRDFPVQLYTVQSPVLSVMTILSTKQINW